MNKKKTNNLLIEVGEFDGVFDGLGAALEPWKDFAGLLGKNMQKLVKQTVFPLKMVFTPLKKNVKFSAMYKEHNDEVDKIKGEIAQYEEALAQSAGSEAKALAIFNPGAALALASARGTFNFLQDPSESSVAKGLRTTGLQYLPGMGWLGEDPEKGETLEDRLEKAGASVGKSSGDGKGGGALSNLFSKIQGVFLLDFSHHERPGNVLREAAGDDLKNDRIELILQTMKEVGTLDKLEKLAKELNDQKEKFMEEFIVEGEAILNLSVEAVKVASIEEFGELLKKYSKDFDELKKIDTKKIREELERAVNELIADEAKAAEFVETLEQEGGEIEKDPEGKIIEEDFRERAMVVFFGSIKGEILKELKSSLENTYDQLQKTVMGVEGLSNPEVRSELEKTTEGKRHLGIVTKNLEKIQTIMKKVEA